MIGSRVKENSTKKVKASLRDLELQILNHVDSTGKRDVTVTSYWDKVVCRLDPRYDGYQFSKGYNKVVCPFHDDVAPSLGLVYDRDGVEVFNCFGCGATGTVIGLHQRIMRKYNKQKGREELPYLISLANIYGVSLQSEISISDLKKDKRLDMTKEPPYTLRMHKENIQKVKASKEKMTLNQFCTYWDDLTNRLVKARKVVEESE